MSFADSTFGLPLPHRGREGWGGLGKVTGDILFASRPLHQSVPDFKPHRLELAAQLMIPEAQHLDPLSREELVSGFVFCPLVRKAVPTAIKFDRQFCDGAIEIQKVDAACVLAAEFEVAEAIVTQQTPQAFFGVGGFVA